MVYDLVAQIVAYLVLVSEFLGFGICVSLDKRHGTGCGGLWHGHNPDHFDLSVVDAHDRRLLPLTFLVDILVLLAPTQIHLVYLGRQLSNPILPAYVIPF